MVAESLGWVIELGLTRNSKFYIGRPIFYTGGLVLTLATLTVGGTVVFNDDCASDDWRDDWDHLVRASETGPLDWAFLSLINSGRLRLSLRALADCLTSPIS